MLNFRSSTHFTIAVMSLSSFFFAGMGDNNFVLALGLSSIAFAILTTAQYD